MASQVENWVGAQQDDDELHEAASLSDFPVDVEMPNSCTNGEATESIDSEDFEFRTFGSGGSGSIGGSSFKLDDDHMCAADEVFFQGQILPLRPSVSSRTESMDRFCGTSRSLGFDWSSRSISRSQSTHSSSSSFSSSSEAGSRHSISSNFYSHPSPKPHLPARTITRRKSISSPTGGALGWGVLRLGPVKAPQIDLPDLRQRKASITNGSSVNGGSKRHDREPKSEKEESCNAKDRKHEKRSIMRFLLRKLSCTRSTTSEVMEPKNCCSNLRRREEGSVSLRHSSSRTFQWLEELSVAKAQVV